MTNLSIFIGTGIQEKLTARILPHLLKSLSAESISIVSLEKLYRLGTGKINFQSVIHINDFQWLPAWYDRSRELKLLTLIPYSIQISKLGIKSKNNLFFVDTGILERSAIFILNKMKRKTIVLQDAMKRKPKDGEKGIINWFGNGKAGNYLVMGQYYYEMISSRKAHIVGSPLFKNKISSRQTKGNKILFINQCFSKYRETTIEEETGFVKEIISTVSKLGPLEIRLHPHNDFSIYKPLSGKNIEISQKKPLAESFKEAGIVLAINSTTILEALAYGLPVLVLEWHPTKFELPIQENVMHCKSPEEMTDILLTWKKNKNDFYNPSITSIQKELKNHIAFSGQESIDNISKAIIDIVTSTEVKRQ